MKAPRTPVHLPQCSTCGLPMSLSRIEPDPDPAVTVEHHTYECAQGHNLLKTVERQTKPA
jgi:hypothetical protein